MSQSEVGLRQCVFCRQKKNKSILFSLKAKKAIRNTSPEKLFSFEGAPGFKGRSAYVCPSVKCLSGALKARKFERALKRTVPDAIVKILTEKLKGLTVLCQHPE
jgi:predicted RNA-binding protein YlxR (DUF448 family)